MEGDRLGFWCPGCEEIHIVTPAWTFNGNYTRPTFSPSVLVTYDGADKQTRCHSFIHNGSIEFLNDCTHKLAGQTVALIPPPDNEFNSYLDIKFNTV